MEELRSKSVNEFLEFVAHQCDVKTAQEFLTANQSNVEQALEAWYDNPDPSRFFDHQPKISWSESQWTEDRLGDHSQPVNMTSCQIDSGHDSNSLQRFDAPLRPPSRLISTISRDSRVDTSRHLSGPKDYEGEIEAVKAASNVSEQQGLSSTSLFNENVSVEGHISPAVAAATGYHQIPISDPDPCDRTAGEGEPVFLKPLPGIDHLSSLITILHSIPICRRELLSPHDILKRYSRDSLWWNGTIQPNTGKHQALMDETSDKELIHELQVLMAFLDLSQRSYGSVYRLSELNILKQTGEDSQPIYLRLLDVWDSISSPSGGSERLNLFTTVKSVPDGSMSDSQSSCSFDFGVINITAREPSLYDIFDKFLGQNHQNHESNLRISIHHPAPVMVHHVAGRHEDMECRTVEIPETFYVDRYLCHNREIIENIMLNCQLSKQIAEEGQLKSEKLKFFSDRCTGKKLNLLDSINIIISYLKEQAQINKANSEMTARNDPCSTAVNLEEAYSQLHSKLLTLKDQIKNLLDEEVKAKHNSNLCSNVFKQPSERNELSPTKGYRFRGLAKVALSGCAVTYIPMISKLPFSSGVSGTSKSSMDWWRLTYDTSIGSALISKEKLSFKEVLIAAGEFDCSTLLVYVSEDFLQQDNSMMLNISEPLKEFVEQDNEAFLSELATEASLVLSEENNLMSTAPMTIGLTSTGNYHDFANRKAIFKQI